MIGKWTTCLYYMYVPIAIVKMFVDFVLFSLPCLCYRYEETLREQQGQLQKEDLSDMVAEHAAKQKVCAIVKLLK